MLRTCLADGLSSRVVKLLSVHHGHEENFTSSTAILARNDLERSRRRLQPELKNSSIEGKRASDTEASLSCNQSSRESLGRKITLYGLAKTSFRNGGMMQTYSVDSHDTLCSATQYLGARH